ncbi:MAG: hypothetical protein V4666_08410 [Bacteroidota bacterium]
MTIQSYMERVEKIRGIANQDIYIFEYTPVRDVFKIRKDAATKLNDGNIVDEEKRDILFQIIEDCERTIKKYLLL